MKKGTIVSYLNDSGKAVIKEIEGDFAIVENEYGFEEKLPLNELIPYDTSLERIKVDRHNKKVDNQRKEYKKQLSKTTEIDLHFTKLVDYPNRYEKKEILPIQLSHAKGAIEKYRKPKDKLIIIHGKGKGVLEKELYKMVENTKKIKFKEADFSKYKLGAIEITYEY